MLERQGVMSATQTEYFASIPKYSAGDAWYTLEKGINRRVGIRTGPTQG